MTYLKQIYLFCLGGILNNAINFLVIRFLFSIGVSNFVAASLGFFAGACISYTFNSIFTFKKNYNPHQALRFALSQLIILLLFSSLFSLFSVRLSSNILVPWSLSLIITTAANFVVLKFIVFY